LVLPIGPAGARRDHHLEETDTEPLARLFIEHAREVAKPLEK
jgi:hypothetical protein